MDRRKILKIALKCDVSQRTVYNWMKNPKGISIENMMKLQGLGIFIDVDKNEFCDDVEKGLR